ncbi:DUF4198 domain-containing protein [Dinoroseobacter sp. S124A]|uniref:DUF4198 domain-containing protein n=1 Tax=Dinoroseobacter sp. S124A TaxID=3415128 RepID=UPI003C7E4EAB
MRIYAPLLLALTLALPARSHEFWISPDAYQVPPGGQIIAELRVGEKLKGAGYPYIPARTARFDILQGDQRIDPEARMGDRPALTREMPAPGLAIVVHETADNVLKYTDWKKFVAFTDHKDFAWAQADHRTRGLPETGFRETYRRYGKALVAVGDGTGADRPVGLETEIVALANPYTDDLEAGLPVRVLYRGAPRRDVQVELFGRGPDGKVAVSLHRTDDAGRVVLPMAPETEYLVDSVIIEPLDPAEEGDPVWHTLWASLTFQTPAR